MSTTPTLPESEKNSSPSFISPKRGRPFKTEDSAPTTLTKRQDQLKADGLPVAKVWFKESVRNENHLVETAKVPSDRPREAEMTLTSVGLFVEQTGKALAIVPFNGNVKWIEML